MAGPLTREARFRRQDRNGRDGEFAPVEGWKLQARPAGVRIVVVGVEVKGASLDSLLARFLKRLANLCSQSQQMFWPSFRFFLK